MEKRRNASGGAVDAEFPIDPSIPQHPMWKNIRGGLTHLFNREELQHETQVMNSYVTKLMEVASSEDIVYALKKQGLVLGFGILRFKLKSLEGAALIEAISTEWNRMYYKLLPRLEAFLLPLELGLGKVSTAYTATKESMVCIRRLCLTAFRDVVLLHKFQGVDKQSIHTLLDVALRKEKSLPAPIKHMLLILQNLKLQDPSEQTICQTLYRNGVALIGQIDKSPQAAPRRLSVQTLGEEDDDWNIPVSPRIHARPSAEKLHSTPKRTLSESSSATSGNHRPPPASRRGSGPTGLVYGNDVRV